MDHFLSQKYMTQDQTRRWLNFGQPNMTYAVVPR